MRDIIVWNDCERIFVLSARNENERERSNFYETEPPPSFGQYILVCYTSNKWEKNLRVTIPTVIVCIDSPRDGDTIVSFYDEIKILIFFQAKRVLHKFYGCIIVCFVLFFNNCINNSLINRGPRPPYWFLVN